MAAVEAHSRPFPRMLLRYVTVQVGLSAIVGLITIALFVSATDLIGNLAGELRDGVPVRIVFQLQVLRIPDTVVQVSWVAMLASLLLVLGQMARRREYVAMLAGGVSIFQLSAPVLLVACLLSLATFGVQEGVVPVARESLAQLRGIYARDGATDLRNTIEDVSYFASGYRSYVIKHLEVDTGIARGIQMHRTEGPGIVESLHATTGTWHQERRRWIWSDATIRTFDADQRVLSEEHVDERVGRLRASPADLRTEKRLALNKYSLSYLSIAQLRRRIVTLARSAQAPLALYVVYYAKWSEPLATIVVALLGIPCALSVERRGMVRGVALCVAACVGFFALRQLGFAMGRGGVVPPLVAVWTPHVLGTALGVYWIRHAPT